MTMATSLKSSTAGQQTRVDYLVALVYVILSITAAIEMRIREPTPGFYPAFESAIASKAYMGQPVLTRYTGITAIDYPLRILVTVFLTGTIGPDRGFQIMQAYFLVSFFPVLSIWCVESGRKANQWSLIGFPVIYSLFYQTIAGAVIIPCYYLAYMYTAAQRRDYFTAASSAVPVAFAKALAPALTIGYLLPTVAMYLPDSMVDHATRQILIALWQPSPLVVSLLLQIFTWVFSLSSSSSQTNSRASKYLKTFYSLCFVVSVVWHVGTLVYYFLSTDPDLSLITAFTPRRVSSDSPLTAGVKYMFQVDFWIIFAASLLWGYMAVYDMKRQANTDVNMFRTFIYYVLGTALLGPAAVLSATWYWRETFLYKTKTS